MDAGCVATKGLSTRHGTVHQHIKTTSRHSVLPPYDSIGKLEPCPASHKRSESALSWLAMGAGENPLGVLLRQWPTRAAQLAGTDQAKFSSILAAIMHDDGGTSDR